MVDIVDDLVGADAQVVSQLLEEAIDLGLVNMTEAADEILLHQQDTLGDVLQILDGHILLCLTDSNELCHQFFAHEIDDFLQCSSFCHNRFVCLKIGANVQKKLDSSKQLSFFMNNTH